MNMETVTVVISIITAIGGSEAIKWLVNYVRNRKHIDKEVKAKADGAEIDNLNDYAAGWKDLFLESQKESKEREAKIDKLYIEIKELRDCKERHIRNEHSLTLENETLKIKKCDKRGCADRIPPSEY